MKSIKEGEFLKVGIYLPVYGGWFATNDTEKGNEKINLSEEEKKPSYSYNKQVACKAEEIGLDSIWIPDHLLNPIKGTHKPSLESWTLASAIAEVTEEIIISHTTLCEAFRYPAVLAKQAATLQEISDGRYWLSMGAGWFKREYEAYGLPFHSHDKRIDRAREALQIIKQLWHSNTVNYEGRYYSISNGILEPKPDPTPLICYGGTSEASRNLVADEAEMWLMRGSNVRIAKKNVKDMKKRLKKRDRKNIKFAMPGLTILRETDSEAKTYLKRITGGNKNLLDKTLKTGLVGSIDTVAQKIKRLEKEGIDHILLQLTPTLQELEKVKKLLKKV